MELIASETLSDDDAGCVAEVSRSADGASVKFQLHEETAALEGIGHLGMSTETLDHQVRFPEMTPEDRMNRVAHLLNIGRERALAAAHTGGNSNG